LALALMSAESLASDWGAAESSVEISVHTTNADGSTRATTIWIAVLEGEAFVRTSGTAWERNIRRDPHAVLTIAGHTRTVTIEPVRDGALIDRVQAQFRAKYGTTADRMARFVRLVLGGGSRIYRVTDR
jgi:hypothetical protein